MYYEDIQENGQIIFLKKWPDLFKKKIQIRSLKVIKVILTGNDTTKCICSKPHPHGCVVKRPEKNGIGRSKCFEMVRGNDCENQIDDSKDGEWEADIKDSWKVK